MRSLAATSGGLLLAAGIANALQVDLTSVSSIKAATKTIASNIINLYEGNNSTGIPGLFPTPYYWWESGLAWDSLINYWSLTGDNTYNDRVSEALLWQVGPGNNYLPPNQTKNLGNDDQSFWALACMTAAENGFPVPASGSAVDSWVQLAQNVFDTQVARWDTKTCGGGLRWQIFSFNNGYNYKNAMSNGNFMQLAARLAKYTGNSTYTDWALKVSQWTFDIGLITNGTFDVWDGAMTTNGCKSPSKIQWTADLGTYLSGYAYLSNVGSGSQYHTYAPKLLTSAIKTFASTPNSKENDVLTEVACASTGTCNTDQQPFRGILARALANTKYIDTGDSIDTSSLDAVLKASAEGAAAQCSGGSDGSTCGSDWTTSKYDGSSGLGQELSALEILLANIPDNATQTSNGTGSPAGASGTPSSTSSNTAGGPSATGAAGTGAASSLTRSTVGLLGALAFAIALSL